MLIYLDLHDEAGHLGVPLSPEQRAQVLGGTARALFAL